MHGLKSIWLMLSALLVFFSAHGTNESEVMIKLGRGRVQVTAYGFELPVNWRQKMETDLMNNPHLADRVISSAVTEVRLGGRGLDRVEEKLTSNPALAIEELENMVLFQLLEARGYDLGDMEPDGIKTGPGPEAEEERFFSPLDQFAQPFQFFFKSDKGWNPIEFFQRESVIWGFRLFKLIALVVITMFLVQLAPDFFSETIANLEVSLALSAGWGVGYFLTFVPVAIVLVITLVGALLLPLQFVLTLYLTTVGCGAVMTFLLRKWELVQSKSLLTRVGLAVALFELLGWIPYLGTVWHVLITAVGTGAAFQVIWRRLWKKTNRGKSWQS